MKIESILNQFSELETEARNSRESTQQCIAQREQGGPSFSLPTPSPDHAQSRAPSVRSDSRTRTPWDAGGYSLPKDTGPTSSSRSPFSAVSWGEQQESVRRQNVSNNHSRQVSMDASAGIHLQGTTGTYALPVRNLSEHRSSQHMRRFSSVSTINGSHALGSGIADLEAKLERLPRITAPAPAAPSGRPDIRLPHTLNVIGSLSTGSPSDSILEARMMRRKHNHLSEDQSYLKPRDHFLNSLDRVHKRTISAPNPAQGSGQVFPPAPTSLPALTSRHLETATLPSPQINTVHERPGLEQYPWAHQGENSPAPSMSNKSPFEPQDSGKILPDRSLQGKFATTDPPCRRFRKVDVNTSLEGGDICMAVESCTTGSVPRKVISHLFGRNKVCTRRIPERVWVCMCRKHYQRIRYRTGADFSVTQIGMVYEQIVRMIFWSRGLETPSRTNQEGIAIRSWTFSIRRREVKRLADTNSRDLVPRWIMQSLGEGKTHDEILDVVERLHNEIQQGTLKDVPPVEFLPEVVDAFTNAPAQVQTHFSSGNEVSISNQPGRSLMTGEAAASPLSFVKESSPLEPVQEEGSMSEHSSEQSSSSPTPPAACNVPRPVYHSRSHTDIMSNRTTPYGFGTRSPLVDSGIGPDTDRRSSLAYYDSQNPKPPSMNCFSVNRQMQAPMSGHRSSYDDVPYSQQAYGGDHHYGLNEFVLTDRSPLTHTSAVSMVDSGDRVYSMGDYVPQSSRRSHDFHASTISTQFTPGTLDYPPHGSVSFQGQAGDSSYRDPTEHRYQFRMSGIDTSLSPSTADERPCSNFPRSQVHQPYLYPAETGSNTRIGRSMNQYQQHTSACVDQTSFHSSRQCPRGEISDHSGVDLASGRGAPITPLEATFRTRYQHGYKSVGEFNDNSACGNQEAHQHNLSTNEGDGSWHSARACDNSKHERDIFSE
ncbi:hypothetical protein F53441_13239 [Fusarium austroafricanum]|uniref:Uncharacterized protein n=1 Tax=Fusarium austroafricanum TaxID=2364996 RepID=A0A8H4NS16_9HYPO|nr:hypothetical protein F53441_13239 [Fusarium austroafricanum]